MSGDEFHRYWKDVHGPLVNGVPDFMRYVRKYVQSHTISPSLPGVASGPGAQVDGVAELWFDSLEDVAKAYAEPPCVNLLTPDWGNFFDAKNSMFFVVEEVVM